MIMKKTLMKWSVFLIGALALIEVHASAQNKGIQQSIVDGAVAVLADLSSDPGFSKHINSARGILIVPSLMKSGGGNGVLLSRIPEIRKMSYPAFYSMSLSASGLQANSDGAAVVLMIMTEKAMNKLLSGTARTGKQMTVAPGSAADADADILQFPAMKGSDKGSLTVTGSTISELKKWNQVYYGGNFSAADILVKHQVQRAGADPLRRAASGLLSK